MNKRFIQFCAVALILSFTSQSLVAGGLFKTITNQTEKLPEPVKKYTLPILAVYPAFLLSKFIWEKASNVAYKIDSWTIGRIPGIKKLSLSNLTSLGKRKVPGFSNFFKPYATHANIRSLEKRLNELNRAHNFAQAMVDGSGS